MILDVFLGRDVAGWVGAWGARLDTAYLESWLDELGVRALWDAAGSS